MQTIQEKSKFLWVGNWPAIDFINTEIVLAGKPADLLEDADDIVLWLKESHLCDGAKANRSLARSKRLIEEARAYRALLRQGIEELADGRRLPSELLKKTNAYLLRGVSSLQLKEDGKQYRWLTSWHFQSAEDYMAPIAESFARLVTEVDPSRIRKCKNPECVLYFYDTSKGGQRAWCSLDLCGNKLRMAASRQRRSAEGLDARGGANRQPGSHEENA
jgi:predicted RNA-binding Zn ribbon-like protein